MKRILIVDDNVFIRSRLVDFFTSQGMWICGEAQDGKEAIAKAPELKPDLILMDNYMPRMSGVEALGILKSMMPTVPVVLLTAFKNKFLTAYAVASGADAVADKDDDLRAILAQVQSLLH